MNAPRRYVGRVRLHIDHIDNAGGQVWAVRVTRAGRNDYIVCHEVIVQCWLVSRWRARAPKGEPRAWLEAWGKTVIVTERRRRIIVHIQEEP